MDNQNVSNNMTQQPVQYYGESDEQKAKRAGVFAFMWLPTILYAVFYTSCLLRICFKMLPRLYI